MLSLGGLQRLPRHDDWLFVGERHLLSGLQGVHRGAQSHCAHQGNHHLVNFRQDRHLLHAHHRGPGWERCGRIVAPDVPGMELRDLFQ